MSLDQGGVAKIMRHHDGRVERGEIERGYGLLVEAYHGVEHIGSFEANFIVILFRFDGG